jgi:radical SAM superfamily enzyme YgiQ (UPF0313 family)
VPDAPAVLLAPGEYAAAHASLGYLAVLRTLLARGLPTHRITAPGRRPPESIEEGRPLRSYRVIGVSLAWELEAAAVVAALRRAGLDPDPRGRTEDDPLIVAGGALTLVNPALAAVFADVTIVGEGVAAAERLAREAVTGAGRSRVAAALAELPQAIAAGDADDPERVAAAFESGRSGYTSGPGPQASPLVAPGGAFGNAFLVEGCRGCPRGCAFCVLRADRGGPFVAHDAGRVIDAVPGGVDRVGLVGAGISDHPALDAMLDRFAARGIGVSTSSLRVASLTPERLRRLAAAGERTVTVGVDGASERLRRRIGKPIEARRVIDAAEAARAAGLRGMKLYVMIGLPEETDADLAEFVGLVRDVSRVIRTSVSVSPLVPKPGTPLGDAPFERLDVLSARRAGLRRELSAVAALDLGSPRTARREHRLAWAGIEEARRLLEMPVPASSGRGLGGSRRPD